MSSAGGRIERWLGAYVGASREWLKKRPALWDRRRALKLLGVLISILLLVWMVERIAAIEFVQRGLRSVFGGEFFGPLFFPPTPPEWKDRVQATALLLGLPAAFLLWHWRDTNVRAQIESQRKDINLKEFQEVQLRASGALNEELPVEAREQLQIAALHQLRGFLRGEYGNSFRRPAFELLLAGHAAAMERIGHLKAIKHWLDANKSLYSAHKEIVTALSIANGKLTAVDRVRLSIVSDEYEYIIGGYRNASAFPLSERRFDWIELPARSFSRLQEMSGCVFVGAMLWEGEFEGVEFSHARLDAAQLGEANFNGARLIHVSFIGAEMPRVNLTGAALGWANLNGANLTQASLQRADLRLANLIDTNLRGACLVEANFDAAKLSHALLWEVDARNARFTNAFLQNADVSNADLRNANFARAWLSGTNFRGADLRGALLNLEHTDRADFTGAIFDAETGLANDWDDKSEVDRENLRQSLLDRGAIRSDLSAS